MLKFNPSHYQMNPFVVYTLEDELGTIQWIGICKYIQLLNVPDARKNPLFHAVFGPDAEAICKILGLFERRHEARNFMFEWMHTNPVPFMMATGWRINNSFQFIKCDQTGTVYPSVTHAANAHGVTQPYISRHLRGDPGCCTINGRYTFSWTSEIPTVSR